MSVKSPDEKIIIALDSPSFESGFSIVSRLRGKIKTFKVGPVLFLSIGQKGIEQLKDLGVDLFLDMKFHDIPSTVEKSVVHIVRYGIKMFTVHSLGGYDMMSTVCRKVEEEAGKYNKTKPEVIAVTLLTSLNAGSIHDIGIQSGIKEQVLRLANLAEKAGVDGLVCSGHEIEFLNSEFGDRFKYIVPGIRIDKKTHDQKRIVTPAEAMEKGADYIVVGRAVTESGNPEQTVDSIIDSVNQAGSS